MKIISSFFELIQLRSLIELAVHFAVSFTTFQLHTISYDFLYAKLFCGEVGEWFGEIKIDIKSCKKIPSFVQNTFF